MSFVNKIVAQFLSKAHTTFSAIDDKRKKEYLNILCLPYFGAVSDQFEKRFYKLCKSFNLECKLVFKPFKVGQYFSLKSMIPKSLQSGVIYQYTCPNDLGITYLGKTKRNLCTRVREHGQINTNSAIAQHRLECNCSFSIDNFKILAICNNEYDLSIVEALYIKEWKPVLNNTIVNQGQSVFLKLY